MHLDPLFDNYRGAGGKCLPKDLKFLIKAAREKGVVPKVMVEADEENMRLLGGG